MRLLRFSHRLFLAFFILSSHSIYLIWENLSKLTLNLMHCSKRCSMFMSWWFTLVIDVMWKMLLQIPLDSIFKLHFAHSWWFSLSSLYWNCEVSLRWFHISVIRKKINSFFVWSGICEVLFTELSCKIYLTPSWAYLNFINLTTLINPVNKQIFARFYWITKHF